MVLRRAIYQLIHGVDHVSSHERTHARSSSSSRCRFMSAGLSMHACSNSSSSSMLACRQQHACMPTGIERLRSIQADLRKAMGGD